MSFVERINALANDWTQFCVDGLVQGSIGLLVVSLIWLLIHKRVSCQLGYWLFFLVLLKPFVPIQVLIPGSLLTGTTVATDLASIPTDSTGLIHNHSSALPVLAPATDTNTRDAILSRFAWLMLGWGVIVCLGLFRIVLIHLRTLRLVRTSTPVTSAERLEFEELARLAGIRCGIRLLWNSEITSPAAACPSAPCVMIPPQLAKLLSKEQLRWTLLHELAHIRRGDLWIMLTQSVIRIVLFFNPIIWVANFIVDQLREQSCDDEAMARSRISPNEAGRGFLRIIEFSGSDQTLLALGFHGKHCHIRSRMMRLIKANRSPQYRLTIPAKIVLCSMALVVLPSVKAQEGAQGVSIRARIAALEAELKVLKREVNRADKNDGAKSDSHHVKPKRTHSFIVTPDDGVAAIGVQGTVHSTRHFGIGLDLDGGHKSLGSHKARISVPGPQKQHYDVFDIDTSRLEKPGLLVIRVQMGDGGAAASFDLFPGDVSIPSDPEQQEKRRVEKSVANLYDVPPGHSGTLIYHFKPGDTFKLGATGNWFSEKDATNTAKIEAIGMDFSATIHYGHAGNATGYITAETPSFVSQNHAVITSPARSAKSTRFTPVLIVP